MRTEMPRERRESGLFQETDAFNRAAADPPSADLADRRRQGLRALAAAVFADAAPAEVPADPG